MPPPRPPIAPFALIAAIVVLTAGAFAYAAGVFSPHRLSPSEFIAALRPPEGPALGHRRNHARGICVTGSFTATGQAAQLSRAAVFAHGTYPVLGRFSLGSANLAASDADTRVRGLALQITTPDGAVWRSANIDPPFFPVATPAAFRELLAAGGNPHNVGAVVARHPEIAHFGAWAKSAPWTASFAEEPYNGLDAFRVTAAGGVTRAVRWSFQPTTPAEPVSQADLARRGPDFLDQDLRTRLAAGPLRWTLVLTVADPSDPTADPSHPWPPGRRTVTAGTLNIEHAEEEADGPCRDINFDPTILPAGIATSDDPFPSARSAVYAKSYDLRTAEEADFPHTASHNP